MPIQSFIDYIRNERRYSEHTSIAYETDLLQLQSYLRSTYEADLTEMQSVYLRSWMVELMESGITAKSVRRKISAVKSFNRFLMKSGLIKSNPATGMALPKVAKLLPTYFDESTVRKALDKSEFEEDIEGIADRMMILLLYSTGMRVSELIGLRVIDVDFSLSLLSVTGKRNKQRLIPLANKLLLELKSYLSIRVVSSPVITEWLFNDKKGKKMTANRVYNRVNLYFGRVTTQEKISPHVLRHTFATHMLNNGAELQAVKDLLGHAGLAATQVYTHVTHEQIKRIHNQTHPRG